MTKTIDYYELGRIVSKAQDEINARLHEKAFKDDRYKHDYIHLNYACFPDHVVDLKVNFACLGEISADKAVAYAEALMEAAEYCRTFEYNGAVITHRSEV